MSEQPSAETFADRRILVTGGSGFLGSHVVDSLRALGAEPVVPRSTSFDLTNEQAVVDLYAETRPELVIHLAARVGGIGANRKNPGAYWYDNLMMGALLLEHARRNDVQKFVQLGTICSYPNLTPVPFREEDLWNGYPEVTNAPYGIAKKALLAGAQSYREQYGMDTLFLMPVNLYGPRDNFDLESSHVIPALIRKMIEAEERGEDVNLWGDGSPSREFLFVDDCARGILLAAERYESSEPVNLGAGFEIKIKDLAELIAEVTGFTGAMNWDTSKPRGQPRRMLDTTRAEKEFGFTADVSFADGLTRTVAWFRENREWIDTDVASRAEAEHRAATR